MAPLLSLTQLQAIRPITTTKVDTSKEEQPCPVATKKCAVTLSAAGCKSLKLLFQEVDAAKEDSSIVILNFEQVLGRRQLERCEQQQEDMLLFEAFEDLLICDNRAWHRMKFVDKIQIYEFDYWQEQKKAMLYHVERIAESCSMSVRLRLVVQVSCDTKTSTVISFLKALGADSTISTLMIAGGLKYNGPTEVWKDVARIFRCPEAWKGKSKDSSTIEFHIFYDGVEKAATSAPTEKSWSNGLVQCIKALEKIKSHKRLHGGRCSKDEAEGHEEVGNHSLQRKGGEHSKEQGERKPPCHPASTSPRDNRRTTVSSDESPGSSEHHKQESHSASPARRRQQATCRRMKRKRRTCVEKPMPTPEQ